LVEPIVVVLAVPDVVVEVIAVPEVVVAVVSVFRVPDVSVIVPEGMAEVELIVPPAVSVLVIAVSVVELELVVMAVSVAAVSVTVVSSFLHPTAKIATANSATRVNQNDFFIKILLSSSGPWGLSLSFLIRSRVVLQGAGITSFRRR
jgi:hypothetical protein